MNSGLNKISVRKFDEYAEITVFCPACKKDIKVRVNYEKRDNASRFPFEFLYVHGDKANRHGITLYLDKHMQVRGSEVLRNIETDPSDLEESKIFPIQKGKISPMARTLGMISKKEFEILELCNGQHSIYDISKKKELSLTEANTILAKLSNKSFVNLDKHD